MWDTLTSEQLRSPTDPSANKPPPNSSTVKGSGTGSPESENVALNGP